MLKIIITQQAEDVYHITVNDEPTRVLTGAEVLAEVDEQMYPEGQPRKAE